MKKQKKKLNKIKNKINSIPKPFIGLLIAIIILIYPLLGNKITNGHDYLFHATNTMLINNKINIFKFDLLLPKIYNGNIANGFGYGTGIFYPPLFYYLTAYISSILNLSIQDSILSITYVQIITIILSGLSMYKFTKKISKDSYIASISSIAYISSAYFLCNIYTRNTIGEALVYVFLPIVFSGLYELFFGDKNKFTLLFTIGYIGLINSHLVITIFITLIILILFLIYYKKVLKKDNIFKLIIASILILLISSPYLVPLIEHKVHGNYVVFEPEVMYSTDTIKNYALTITDFFMVRYKTNTTNGIEVYMSFITLITSILTIINHKKIFNTKDSQIYKIILLITFISAYISSIFFPWEHMPYFIKIIQFPWRLCIITTFGISVLSGYIIKIFPKKDRKIVASMIAILMIFFGYSTISKENIIDKIEIPITNKMSLGYQDEYLPSNVKENMSYYSNRNQDIIIKKGSAEIDVKENNYKQIKSEIKLNSNEIIIELPRLYYLGYQIKLTDQKGNKTKINYYENDYGFIEFKLNKSGIIEVEYKGTIANQISNYICFITTLLYIIVSIYKNKKRLNYLP